MDRFELVQEIGAGGMGVVYRALDRQTGAAVALKLIARPDAQAAARFAREATVLAELEHPAIVRYVAHGEAADGRRYLAMEWLEGQDLRARLARGVLPLAETLTLAGRMADALAFAHARGVLHRDLKPSNILLPGDEPAAAKLIDFGLARIVGDSARLTGGGARLGTPAYMAPEQVRGEASIDSRADLFALGAVLFECLTGRAPHEGQRAMAVMAKRLFEDAPRLASLRPDLPAALDDLVAKLLARDRTQRPADARDVALALRALAEGREHVLPSVASASIPAALGEDESQLVCVVLAAAPDASGSSADEATEADGSEASPATPTTSPATSVHEQMGALAQRYGARMEPLYNGSFAAVLSSGGAATDLCARGAGYALGLRELVVGSRLALTVGPAVLSRPLALDAIIETVAALAAEEPSPFAATGVRLDEVAAGLLDARFEQVRDQHSALLVGRAAPDTGGRRLLGRPTPFVGRARELRAAAKTIAGALASSESRAVLVTGPPGIGKSRLLNELLRTVDAEGATMWVGRGDPLRQATPFGLLTPALRQAAGLEDGMDAAEARRRVLAFAGRVEPADEDRVAAFLGELCGLPPPAGGAPEFHAAHESPILHADQLQRAWEELVLWVTAALPLVLVLEDLHWSDAPSMKLVEVALRVGRARPLIVLATARPEVQERFPALFEERALTRLELGELGQRASVQLAAAVLGERAGRAQIERIAERSAGNALVLEELIRAAAEGASDDVPATVKAMAMVRLSALEADDRRVLRAGSVFGDAFSTEGVAHLLGRSSAVGLAARLASLREREWVSADTASGATAEDEHRFRHGLLREAAYATLTETDRQLGHRLAGEWLVARGERNAAALATHFERGGDRARASHWHARAAEQTLAANDLQAVLVHAAHAVRCGARGDRLGEVRLIEAVAHHWLAAHDAERRCALEALRLLPTQGASWFRAIEELAEASLPLGDVDTLVALADGLEPATPELGGEEAARHAFLTSAATLTMQLALGGRLEAAEAVMVRLEASVADGPPPPPSPRARIEFARATLAMIAGDLGRVIERALAAVVAYEEAGDLREAAFMRSNLASVYADIGAWAAAEEALREATAVAEHMGFTVVLAHLKNNLGLVLARRGDLRAGLAVEAEAVALFAGAGNQRNAGGARIYLALIHALAGDSPAAEREARAAIAVLAQTPPMRAYAQAALAQVLLARGEAVEAAVVAREAMALLTELGAIDAGEPLVRLVHAEALFATGQPDAARAAIRVARDQLLERAARISDATWAQSLLTQVPENARTLELSARWGV